MRDEKKLGIYIHIPFCTARCAYCDFYSTTGGGGERMWRYAEALKTHIEEYAPQLDGYLIDTVYFGGGTPTRLGAARLIFVLDALKKNGHVSLDAEITLEANPESVTLPEMKRLRRAGFNRVSLGVQSAKEPYLQTLGRMHSFKAAEAAVAAIRAAGFRNMSVDVMFGLPYQTRDDFADDLLRIAALKPEHISCYGLRLEEDTPLYLYNDSPYLPDDDQQADMYLYATDMLKRYGYIQYEVSNFTKKGYQSRHNIKYWLGNEYLGFGASAASYIGGARFSIVSDINQYMGSIERGGGVIESYETITGFDLLSEYLMLRLRTTYGVSEDEYREIYNCGMTRVLELLRTYEECGWARNRDGRWMFTPKGFLLSNTLINELLDAQQRERAERVRPWQAAADGREQTALFLNERPTIGKFI